MPAPKTAPAGTFTTRGVAQTRVKRFSVNADFSVTLTDADGNPTLQRIGYGTRDSVPFLVLEDGSAQTGIPMLAVATALASGRVIAAADIAAAFKETGQLDALKGAIDKLG
jgi:hypothetical protein